MANLIELALVLKSLNYRDMQTFVKYLERKPSCVSTVDCLLEFADWTEEDELKIAQNISGPVMPLGEGLEEWEQQQRENSKSNFEHLFGRDLPR